MGLAPARVGPVPGRVPGCTGSNEGLLAWPLAPLMGGRIRPGWLRRGQGPKPPPSLGSRSDSRLLCLSWAFEPQQGRRRSPGVQACFVQKKRGKSPHSCCSHYRRHQTEILEAALPHLGRNVSTPAHGGPGAGEAFAGPLGELLAPPPPSMDCHVRLLSGEKRGPRGWRAPQVPGPPISAVGRETSRGRIAHPCSLGLGSLLSHRQLAEAGGERGG